MDKDTKNELKRMKEGTEEQIRKQSKEVRKIGIFPNGEEIARIDERTRLLARLLLSMLGGIWVTLGVILYYLH